MSSLEDDAALLITNCFHGCGLLMNAISGLANNQDGSQQRATELLYRAVELQKALAVLLERLVRNTMVKHAN